MKTWAGVALSAYLLSGCVVVDGHGEGAATLSVEWTIARSTDPEECYASDVRYAYIMLKSRSGMIDEFDAPCRDFGADIDLDPGTYWVTVVLQDRSHHDRTTAVESERITIYEDEHETVHIDFPDSSFL